VTRAAFTMASAASTTAGKPNVSTIPTAIAIVKISLPVKRAKKTN
jgi:hypothetical protein